jgi:energy-coupling factor transporter ATP-binding protein EcfA2
VDPPAIEFLDASYRTPRGAALVDRFPLAINTGEVLALVGRSGAGKTTILKLINRLLVPSDNLRFAQSPSVMDLTLSHRALASGQVDLIAGDATAGLIKGLDLFRLEDNRHYFPPYDAVPVARAATLLRYPEVLRALEGLAGRISADGMQAMNDAVDARHEDPAEVVRRFLAAR